MEIIKNVKTVGNGCLYLFVEVVISGSSTGNRCASGKKISEKIITVRFHKVQKIVIQYQLMNCLFILTVLSYI